MQATSVQQAGNGLVEWITDGAETLAVLIYDDYEPDRTTFLTPPEFRQQVGFVVGESGSEIPRHDHLPIERTIHGTAECLVVRRGLSEVTIYDRDRREVCRRIVRGGDVLLLVAGGHGFRQIEETVFLEIKQGPYPGVEEKERF
jgi:uncharacterized protein with PhoU and TrkA domain